MCLQSHHILWIWMAPLCHSSVKQDAQATKAFAIKTHYSLTNNTHSHEDKKKTIISNTLTSYHTTYTHKNNNIWICHQCDRTCQNVLSALTIKTNDTCLINTREGVSNQVWWENLTILRVGDFVWICMVWFVCKLLQLLGKVKYCKHVWMFLVWM